MSPASRLSFYRLKQVDFDGMHSYSPVVTVYVEKDSDIMVYPNPAIDHITIANLDDKSQDVIITDLIGKVVKRIHLSKVIERDFMKVDISTLNKGSYFIKTSSGISFITKI